MYRRFILVALAAAAVASGAIAISQAATAPKHTGTPTAAARKHAKAWKHQRIAGALVRRFSILRSARTAATTAPLSASDAEHFTEPGTEVAEFQLEPDQARSLNVEGTQAWVIPGRTGLCLTVLDPGGKTETTVCGSVSQTASKGDLFVARESSGPVVYGLAPDGDSVTVTNENGSHSVPVTSNFFKYNGGSTAQSVSIRNADGAVVEKESLTP